MKLLGQKNQKQTLQSNIDAEVSRAKDAESQLQANLDTESARAKAAEESLINKTDQLNQNLIDTQNNLAAEILRATNAESEIYDHIHEVEADIDGKIDKSEKGQPNGVATLDEKWIYSFNTNKWSNGACIWSWWSCNSFYTSSIN